tara:strand:+ start:777 stop:1028 length:252 start_codon:yes stop_codon:yes gene_type:complete
MSKVNKFGFPMIPEYEYLVPDNFWSYTKSDQVKCLLKAIDSFLPDAQDVDESERSEESWEMSDCIRKSLEGEHMQKMIKVDFK